MVNPTPSIPTITASGSTTFCEGEIVLLTSSQGTGNEWSDGFTGQNNSVTTAGSYTVTYTDGNGCSATSDPTVVNVNPIPSVDGGPDQSICEGTQTVLTGSGALSYTWDNEVIDGEAFTPTSTITYNLTGTDANGCSNTDQVIIIVNALPVITMAELDSVCIEDGTFELIVATPTGGMYVGPGISNNELNPSIAGLGIHTISYSYTDANGCTNSETIDIEIIECTNSIIETGETIFEIYPNPTSGNVHIELNGSFTYQLVDSRGRMITSGSSESSATVNISNIESGVYLVNLKQNGKTYIGRIIKQ